MSTVVFVSHKIPEKHLLSERTYKYFPDSTIKDSILADIVRHSGISIEDYDIEFDLKIILKEYKNANEPTKNP